MIQALALVLVQPRSLQDREMKLVKSQIVASFVTFSAIFGDDHSPFLQQVTYLIPAVKHGQIFNYTNIQ